MTRILLMAMLFFSINAAYSQEHSKLVRLYFAHKYDKAMEESNKYLQKDSTNAIAWEMIGSIHYLFGRFDSCFIAEKKALLYDNEQTLISCRAHLTLSNYYNIKGDMAMAVKELQKINLERATRGLADEVKARLREYSN